MLRSVVENYIRSLKERDFDVPLLCILFKNDFYDIHFLHGMFEFGKDFIAKKKVDGQIIQYVFQSKAGNINLKEWGNIRWQIDEARLNLATHPNYDTNCKREIILITTGRLVGGASISAQEYSKHCISRGELGLKVWDIDTILELILSSGVDGLSLVKENPSLMSMLSDIRLNKSSFKKIEKYSNSWVGKGIDFDEKFILGIILESHLIISELVDTNRITLACYTSLLSIRPIIFNLHLNGGEFKYLTKNLGMVEDTFERLVLELCQKIDKTSTEREGLFHNFDYGFSAFIEYPVICSQIIELIGLLGLLHLKNNNVGEAEKIALLLNNLVINNSGITRPISDRYACSFIPPTLLLLTFKYTDTVKVMLRNLTTWLCDRYEVSDAGLANPYATEKEEVEVLLGYAFEFKDLHKRKESYLATVILDLIGITGLNDLYELVLNDILAVSIYPIEVISENTTEQYVHSDKSIFCPQVHFREDLLGNLGWRRDMLINENKKYFCEENGLWWETLALNAILRDTHRPYEILRILNDNTVPLVR